MTDKLTTYDPAEDLTSDEAIAAFMAGAFETNDAGFISHPTLKTLLAVMRALGIELTTKVHVAH